jgi:hypothetical protein
MQADAAVWSIETCRCAASGTAGPAALLKSADPAERSPSSRRACICRS